MHLKLWWLEQLTFSLEIPLADLNVWSFISVRLVCVFIYILPATARWQMQLLNIISNIYLSFLLYTFGHHFLILMLSEFLPHTASLTPVTQRPQQSLSSCVMSARCCLGGNSTRHQQPGEASLWWRLFIWVLFFIYSFVFIYLFICWSCWCI